MTCPPLYAAERKCRLPVDGSLATRNKAVLCWLVLVRVKWRFTNNGLEMRKSHGFETDLNRSMDLTGSRVKISSMISFGNEFFVFFICCSSRVFISTIVVEEQTIFSDCLKLFYTEPLMHILFLLKKSSMVEF